MILTSHTREEQGLYELVTPNLWFIRWLLYHKSLTGLVLILGI